MRSDPADPAPATEGQDEPEARSRRTISLVVSWCVAIFAIGYVFTRVPIAEAWEAARAARLDLFGGVMLSAVATWFAIESGLYAFLFSRFNANVSRAEARSLRGMSYLLTPIHYNVAKAAVVLRLRQTKQVPLLEGTSTLLFYQSADGLILASFAILGTTLLPGLGQDASAFSEARTGALVLLGLTLFNIVFLRLDWPRYRAIDWWRGLPIHRTHRRFEARDFLVVLVAKSAYHFLFVVVFYLGLRAFGVALPFALVLAATPIIQVVGALPISPAGLGTQQAAMLYFFGGSVGSDEARVVAFGFSFPIVMIGLRCLLGLFYLHDLRASRLSPDAG